MRKSFACVLLLSMAAVALAKTRFELEATMTEICYAKGQKVILVTRQIKNSKWLCKFSIPGSSHLDGFHGQYSSKGYNTEWDARTNAFQRAKLLLGIPQGVTQGSLPERA